MLINSLDNYNQVPTPLEILDVLPIKFYLTGSRFFNAYHSHPVILDDSIDYDYFCEYSEYNVKNVMEALVHTDPIFFLSHEVDMYTAVYTDKNIVGVAFIKSGKQKIDLQFVKSVEMKKEVQQILAAMGGVFSNTSKITQKWLWDKQYERICKERNIVL